MFCLINAYLCNLPVNDQFQVLVLVPVPSSDFKVLSQTRPKVPLSQVPVLYNLVQIRTVYLQH